MKDIEKVSKKWNANHREYYRLRDKRNYEANPELFKKRAKEYRARIKFRVFEHYGNKCSCCGETIKEFLSIDHIKNGGTKMRRETGIGTTQFYKWLIDHNFPEGYRLLCMNCNWGRRMNNGTCPHERK